MENELGSANQTDENKMPLTSHDVDGERLGALRALFPEAWSDGTLNVEKLAQLVGQSPAPKAERYGLSWAGKAEAHRVVQSLSTGTLRPAPQESVNFETSGNLILEGDNLEVLKLLQKSYARRVKMIYIDPPYNTGNEFIYPDNFREGLQTYLEYSGQVRDGVRQSTNAETNGRYHSNWLNMMYPRLFLARNLLKDDGVIFISIDDHEVQNLRLMMNEIFGEENFIAQMVWEGTGKNDSRFISVAHDYILCFARSKEQLKANEVVWRTRKEGIDAIYKKVEELKQEFKDDYVAMNRKMREWYLDIGKGNLAWQHRHYNRIDKKDVYFSGDISWPGGGGPRYEVLHPETKKPVTVPSGGWRFPKPETMRDAMKDERIEFGENETKVPTLKRYLRETEGQVVPSVFYVDRRAAMQRLRLLLGEAVFENPKDERVLKKLMEATTGKDDIVLDFFAGSGTTAQAVLELNKEDGGNRQFILVQLPEPTGNIEYSNITEITKERVRRVIAKMNTAADGKLPLDDGAAQDRGFKVFKLDASNFKVWDGEMAHDGDALAEQLRLYAEHRLPDRSSHDILFELLLKSGRPLTAPIEERLINDQTVFVVDGGALLIYLAETVDETTLEQMIALSPEQVLCLDAGFGGNDQLKNNIVLQMKDAGLSFRTV